MKKLLCSILIIFILAVGNTVSADEHNEDAEVSTEITPLSGGKPPINPET